MIFLFFGSNDFARKQALAELRASLPADTASLNFAELEGRALKLPELRMACDAFPLLADRRLVIVHDVLKSARSAELRDGLRAIIKTLPATTDLVLNESEAPDQRLAVIKDLQALGKQGTATIREFAPLSGNELVVWLRDHAHSLGLQLQPAAAQLLADYAGSDGWMLHNELLKLGAFAAYQEPVTPAMVEMLVSDATEANMFAFIDALCGRRGPAAVVGLQQLLDDDAAPLYILAMIARQVRIMLAAHDLGRVNPQELAQRLGQKPFVARKAAEQARGFTAAELRALHTAVIELDHGIKTGRADAAGGLATLVATFAYPANHPQERRA